MDYYYHHYGPYSSDLQLEVDLLVDRGFLQEEKYGESYLYKITKEGKNFLRNYEAIIGVLDAKSSAYKEIIHKLKQKPPQFLELLSTYLFLLESGYNHKTAIEKVKKLKPTLCSSLSEAIDFWNEDVVEKFRDTMKII